MKLTALVYVQQDGFPAELHSAYPCFPLAEVSEEALLAWKLTAEEALLLAATDEELTAAAGLGLAAAAYVHPLHAGQRYAQAQMLIEGFAEVDDLFLERVYRRCHGLPWSIARTRRCLLRELTLSDLPALEALYEKEGVSWRRGASGERLPGFVEPLYPHEEEEAFQRAYISNMYGYYGYGMWLVFTADGQTLIGRAGLENRAYPDHTELELGYVIAPEWQRRGIAGEVCAAVLSYARELGFRSVSALTEPENTASIGLLRKLGFVCTGKTDVSGSLCLHWILREI